MGLYYLRSIYSLFVFDEATTFLSYVHNNKSITGDAFWSANNQSYTQSGTYNVTVDGSPCPTYKTLILQILSTYNVTDTTVSGPFTWNDSTYSASGTYTYNYTNGNGCPSVDTLRLTINLPQTSNSFAFPNPSSDGKFTLKFGSVAAGSSLKRFATVYDIKGNRLVTFEDNVTPSGEMPINMSGYPRGLYLVELADSSGKRLTTGKIMIQ